MSLIIMAQCATNALYPTRVHAAMHVHSLFLVKYIPYHISTASFKIHECNMHRTFINGTLFQVLAHFDDAVTLSTIRNIYTYFGNATWCSPIYFHR
ncbi:hypothetical protein ABG067_005337 [Albugo candida]